MSAWDALLIQNQTYMDVLHSISASKTHSELARDKNEVDINWILKNPQKYIRSIKRELRSEKKLLLSPKQKTAVRLGKMRYFYLSPTSEKILLMALGRLLTEALEPKLKNCVFSFRKGRGPHQALRSLARYVKQFKSKNVYILQRDVSSYGDSIDKSIAIKMLSSLKGFRESRISRSLIIQALDIRYAEDDGKITSLEKGIPAGSPLTPPIENLYLMPLDNTLSSIKGCWYGRYGDDFVFATTDLKKAKEADQEINRTMLSLGLAIKESKKFNALLSRNTCQTPPTSFCRVGRIEWLGSSIQAQGSIGIKYARYQTFKAYFRKQIESLVWRLSRFELSKEQRLSALKTGLKDIYAFKRNLKMQNYFYANHNPELLKDLDHTTAHFVVRMMSKYWNLHKRACWRNYQTVKPTPLYRTWLQRSRGKKVPAAKTKAKDAA